MGQQCSSCLRAGGTKYSQDVDLSKKYPIPGLQTIREENEKQYKQI